MSVLVFVSLARLALADVANTEIALSVAAGIALFTVVRYQSRQRALAAAAITAAAGVWSLVLIQPQALVGELISEAVLLLLVLASAELLRSYQARIDDRVEAEATARVHAERLRIARDLHDIIAHSLSNIAVQSGVAARLIKTDPDHAARALEIINESGRSSLDELRSFLGLLRAKEDMVETHPTPEQPADLQRLFDSAREAGIDLDVRRSGQPSTNSSMTMVLAMYRIVQESLTNVVRHAGSVPTIVEIRYGETESQLRITNQPGAEQRAPVPSTGVGILGMKERAEAIGGHLTTERRPDGGFVVTAILPNHHQEFSRPS